MDQPSREMLSSTLKADRVVVGELTINTGLAITDDHFLVVASGGPRLFEISFGDDDIDEIEALVECRMGREMRFSLVNSVEFRSVVQFPGELEGVPLFDLRLVENPAKGLGYWMGRLIGRKPMARVLSRPVIEYLEGPKG